MMTTHPVSATSELVQTLILSGILLWSVIFVVRKYAPAWMNRQQTALAQYSKRQGLHRLAHWLEPALIPASGCGSGCNTCGSCPMNPAAASGTETTQTKPVQWKTPSSSPPASSSGCH